MEPPTATNKKLDKTNFEEVALLQLLFFLLLDHYLDPLASSSLSINSITAVGALSPYLLPNLIILV